MSYLYGPIPSRRLGQSLGVDPIPLKTCNWNCVYCQLGRTTPLIHARAEYVPRADLIQELAQTLATHEPGEIDFVSFVGSGEPTLHCGLGWMIRRVKQISDIPVAVITNGSLLYLSDVRAELTAADVVMPTLTTVDERAYQRIHRPHPDATLQRLLQGLITFRREFSGRLWIEVMLLRNLNDSEQHLRELAKVIARIDPDEVQITLPTRPPSEMWVAPADEEGLLRATAILGDSARIVHPGAGYFDLRGYESIVDAIIAIVSRHPMSHQQLLQTLDRWVPDEVESALAGLAAGGQVQVIERYGTRFWIDAQACFPAVRQPTALQPVS